MDIELRDKRISRYTKSDEDLQKHLASLCGRIEEYLAYRREFDLARKEHVRPKRPVQVMISTTNYCNLMCKMCARNWKRETVRENMSLEMARDISVQIKEMKTPSIWLGAFTECMLHPEFPSLIHELAKSDALDFWVLTNGTKLQGENVDILFDAGVTWLSVSLDAATDATYKAIRGADLGTVEQNIRYFLAERERRNSKLPLLRVSFVKQNENKHELDMFMAKWSGVADIIDLQTLVDFSALDGNSPKGNSSIECTNPYWSMSILHNGQYLPCCNYYYETKYPVYMRDMKMQDYWKSDIVADLLKSFQTKEYNDCCARCINSFTEV